MVRRVQTQLLFAPYRRISRAPQPAEWRRRHLTYGGTAHENDSGAVVNGQLVDHFITVGDIQHLE